MFMPQVEENINQKNLITQWRGYNHNYEVGMGEFYDMENMTCDGFPVIMCRNIRPTLLNAVHGYRGILYTDGALCYLDGNTFHYKTWMLDLTPLVQGEALEVTYDSTFVDEPDEVVIHWGEVQLIRFGAYVLIFGDYANIWVNISDDPLQRVAGLINSDFRSAEDVDITYTLSTIDGEEYDNVTESTEPPAAPDEGDYWLNTTAGSLGLYIYLNSAWQPVPSTYIRIEIEGAGFDDYFREEDIINMNISEERLRDLNNGSMIQSISSDYIVVIGIMNTTSITEHTSSGYTLHITRTIPDLDFICADKNRLWGCKYGYDSSGSLINEIHCSKLGDFKNWYSFQGLSTDSYSANIGTPGAFTGCISYNNYPTFFKENAIIRVSGNYPAEYNVSVLDARGVQAGSEKSLAIVGEALFYKAPGGVMAYDGSLPRMISAEWGKDAYYYEGVAGVHGSKYYIEVENTKGGHTIFVYDSQLGLWTRENRLGLLGFSGGNDGRLFGFSYISIFGFGTSDNVLYTNKQVSEEWVDWFLETGDMGVEVPEFKFISKLAFRAYIPSQSEVAVEISYDDKPFEQVGVLRGYHEMTTQVIDIVPYRCDHYRLKLKGHGNVRFHTLYITYNAESEDYEYHF